MLTVVLLINGIISIVCLLVAWQLWNLRQQLANIADAIFYAERSTYTVLHGAPHAIAKGQLGVHQLRLQYQRWEIQLQQIQQVLLLFSLGLKLWPKSSNRQTFKRPKSLHKRI